MRRLDLPANLTLLQLTPARVQTMRPVTVLDIFDGSSDNFHENGLFSLSIFGRVGSPERDLRFSYIDLKATIFHPFVFKQLCKLKALYGSIMSGKAYAVWDPKLKDFVASDIIHGETGYQFFMSHWLDLEFPRNQSDERSMRIDLMDKHRTTCTLSKIAVIPAGLRDIQIDESGKRKEGEINDFYRSLIAASNTIATTGDYTSTILDTSRYAMQMAFNKVYDYLDGLVSGKTGFAQGKWGNRRIYNGTRNVITAMDTSTPYLGAPNAPSINHTAMGLYQTMVGMLPVSKHLIMNGWLAKVFTVGANTARLVNKTSLRSETVNLSSQTVDRWTTTAGIEKVIHSFKDIGNRGNPVTIEGRYLGLVYLSDKEFKIFGDIDELPRNFDRKLVHPITLVELLYLSGYRSWNQYPAYVTRYPVTGIGSIYPSWVYVKTTIKAGMRWELGDDWNHLPDNHIAALEYPEFGSREYVDSLIPNPSRLGALGGDFDGDTCSANILYTDDSIRETGEYFNRVASYLDARGGLKASAAVGTVQRVLLNMTR